MKNPFLIKKGCKGMSLKRWINRALAVLYAIFSFLMLSAAIASITAQMCIGAAVCVVIALIGFYMTFRRWQGDKGAQRKKNETYSQGHDIDEMSGDNKKERKKKRAIDAIAWTLISFIILVIVFAIGSVLVASRNNIRYMESSAVPLIEALEKYKEVKGSYPDTLQQLQPTFISELPACRQGSANVISYSVNKEHDEYNLNCYTGFYTEKRRYNSQTKGWKNWD